MFPDLWPPWFVYLKINMPFLSRFTVFRRPGEHDDDEAIPITAAFMRTRGWSLSVGLESRLRRAQTLPPASLSKPREHGGVALCVRQECRRSISGRPYTIRLRAGR